MAGRTKDRFAVLRHDAAVRSVAGNSFVEADIEDVAELLRQRDELLAACEAVEAHLVTTFPPYPPELSPFDKVRVALDMAKGQSS
jgi:hypothetical protein